LMDNSYYFKLCGAGGGGFFYIFSKNTDSLADLPDIISIGSDIFPSEADD
jgi:hypothetical protein